ncbi:MAG TPA: alpha/beta hydrolase [Actinomycetota bacterium]|nr:alpha/beta hydrolase [Actinomycetota bacterium]
MTGLIVETVRSADGTAIAYERRGSGPPLLVIGGALTDRRAAADLAEALAPNLEVLTFDRRGRGASGDTPPYTPDRELEDVAALIGAAGGRAALFGHSSGGALALEAARRLGATTVSRLAVYEPPFIVEGSRPPVPIDAIERLEELVAAGRRGDAVAYFLVHGPGVPPDAVAEMHTSPGWTAHEAIAHTIAYDLRVMGDAMRGSRDPLARFTSVTVPTLVIDGGASPSWQHAAADAIAEVMPHARRVTLPGQGHGAEPAVLAPVLASFVAGE